MTGIDLKDTHEKSSYTADIGTGQIVQNNLNPVEFSVDDINKQEQSSAQEYIPEQQSSPQEYNPNQQYIPSKPKNRANKKQLQAEQEARFKAEEERDLYAKKAAAYELLLNKEKADQLKKDKDQIGSVLQLAKQQGDDETYVKATTALTENALRLADAEKALKYSYDQFEQIPEEDATHIDDAEEDRKSVMYNMSHKREINSEDYQDWLEDHPEYNPYSDDYNSDLTQELIGIKKEFNKYLHANKLHNSIGTPEYYSSLDHLINQYNQNMYGATPMQPKQYTANVNQVQQQPQQYVPQTQQPQGNYYAPVSRTTANPYAAPQQRLPELSEFEKRIAEVSPMTDMPQWGNGGISARPLTLQEKYQRYAENKMRLGGGQ